MSSSAALSDDVIAAAAKRNLAPITKIAMPGHTVKSLLHAGGAPVASTLLGAGAGFVSAPSGEGSEGAVRGAIAGGLTGLAHRAINAHGAVEAASAANALRQEQAAVNHLATAVHGEPVLPYGGGYDAVSTPTYNVRGMQIHGAPQKATAADLHAESLDRAAAARTRAAGVGGRRGQGTPVAASTIAGGVAGSTTPKEEKRAHASDAPRHPYEMAAMEKDASLAELLGAGAGKLVARESRFRAPAGLSLLDRLKIWRNGGLTPEHAAALSGGVPELVGVSHGVAARPASAWDELKGRTRDLFAHNSEAAAKNKLMLAQNYANGLGAGGGPGDGFMRGFAGATDAGKRDMPQVFPGAAGPLPHATHAFSPAPGASSGALERAAQVGAGSFPASQQFPSPEPEDALTKAQRLRGEIEAIRSGGRPVYASADAVEADAQLAKHAAGPSAASAARAVKNTGKAVAVAPTIRVGARAATAAPEVAQAERAAQIAHEAHLKHQAPPVTAPGAGGASPPAPPAPPASAAVAEPTPELPRRPTVVPRRSTSSAATAGGAPPVQPPTAAGFPASATGPMPAAGPAPTTPVVDPSDAIRARAKAEAQSPFFAGTAPEAATYQQMKEGLAASTRRLQELEAERARHMANRLGGVPTDPSMRSLDAVDAEIAHHTRAAQAHKEGIDSYHAEVEEARQAAEARKAEIAARDASLKPSERGSAPGSAAEHGGVQNPWASLPIVNGHNMAETIASRQAATGALMNQRTGERALSGALAGAGTGYLAADDEHKGQGALVGAAAGGGLGAGIGHFEGERAKELVTRPLQAKMHGVSDPTLAAKATKELEGLQSGSATNRLAGAGAGAVASGLTSRGAKREDETKTASSEERAASLPEDGSMHPYAKLAKDEAEKNGDGQEKIANLLGRLLGGAAVGGGLGAGAGYFMGQRDPSLSDDDRSSYMRRGALLGGIGGGAAGAFSHQLAQHAVTPGMAHPGMALSDKVLAGLTATGVTGLGALATKAWNGPSNADADSAKSKALGTMAAQDEAHSMAVKALAPTQMMVFDAVLREDPSLAHADPQLLHDSFETMRKTAPRLSTDKSAVKSFLREVASYGTGPNYITIKNLAETEKALNQTFKA